MGYHVVLEPDVEAARLAKLASFGILDTPREREFDAIVALARHLVGCPIALVSLVDDRRQWFKAGCGLGATETPRDQAFCAHALARDDVMMVEDATRDPRFADSPLVTGQPHIRFYAGVPLRPRSPGFSDDLPGVGTLCVIDTVPRTLDAAQLALLRDLAVVASALIHARACADTATRLSIETRERASMLDRRHQQLRQAERMAGIGSWRLDLADQRVEWSDHVFTIHGLPVGGAPPLGDAMRFYPAEDRARVETMLARAAALGEPFDFEGDFHTADGRQRRVRSIGEPEVVDGRPVGIVGVFQDVTERHAREQSLRLSADTDKLTGLPNRACFEARVDAAVARARANGEPLAVLLLDLDGFKEVNDTFGHEAGDEVLRVIADRLRGQDCANAFAARLGGDEFVLLVSRPRDCARLSAVVTTLLGYLRQEIARGGVVRSVSATIGGAILDDGMANGADLLRCADLALYEAKRSRRGSGRIFGRRVPCGAAPDRR